MLTLDPALFAPAAADEETLAFNARLEEALRAVPPTHAVPVEETRRAREEGRGLFPPAGPLEGSRWLALPGGGRVRVSAPEGAPRGVYLHIHGGGWTLGSPAHYDLHNQRIARRTGAAVVSVAYPLAPEHPWPAAPEACLAAALWTLDEGARALGAGDDAPMIVGGESAGAHLAALTLLALRDAGRMERVRGAILNYGMYDLRMTPSAAHWGARQLVLSTPTIAWFVDNFVSDRALRADPRVSPLLAALEGMPPALFQVGTWDPLLDDTLMMAARWVGAGAEADLRVYPGGVHAFNMFDLKIARDYQAAEDAFIRARLGG
ncbi:alpha/beta hydrolase fold domain-containing protein [Oceanicella actignis]|uniref:Acetyl esterase/lipase n=1 Tax=Oceanicella actignis TaxID=1189325 RepID=A0A1M7RX07_9RHOB|nr:alpha/beta hydrolase fold domain-containing protein [Oceanicella actignis]SES99446.1 Acetyl esterase/lipase [Oceanicella actignis]SHN50668.1 Acetyl esterase/lipase [Oceanicella actignis]